MTSDPDRINAAVRECLNRCYSSENALVCLVEYLDELRSAGQWNDSDLAVVRATVSRLLRQIGGDGGDNLSP